MKREEKSQQMRRRIMDSAIAEFSMHGYGGSSTNNICAGQDFSKGIVYHYFETKDALYLACVQECFKRLTEYIQGNINKEQCGIEEQLENYFTVRMSFFRAYPLYQRIFCEALIAPPAHLSAEIRKCRRDFDEFNIQTLERMLTPLHLRPSISKADVIDTFRLFQDFINVRYQAAAANGKSFEAHEEECRKALNILLYGIIERK